MRSLPIIVVVPLFAIACSGSNKGPSADAAAAAKAPAASKLGIRPDGDTELKPDLSKVPNDDLKKVFAYIDEHIDEHVENLQKWIRQPSISNSRRRHSRIGRNGEGLLRRTGLQADACLRRRHHRVRAPRAIRSSTPRCDEGADEDGR